MGLFKGAGPCGPLTLVNRPSRQRVSIKACHASRLRWHRDRMNGRHIHGILRSLVFCSCEALADAIAGHVEAGCYGPLERPLRDSMRTRRGCDMVSRSTAATTARRRKATLKMAAREKEIIGAVWGERERDLSSGLDEVGASRPGERGERSGE